VRAPLAAGLVLALAAPVASAQAVSRTVGSVTFRAELEHARPGGLVVARLSSRSRLGAAYAILDGRRAPFYPTARGPRALVPIPAESPAGPNTLGFELWARRGRQRIPLQVEIAPAAYPARSVEIPASRLALLEAPDVTTEARQLLLLLRTESPTRPHTLPFGAPVVSAETVSFGSRQAWPSTAPVESLMDGVFGERHRGLDFAAAAGAIVAAPAAGTVLFAGSRTLTGGTLVVDHGQGIVSLFAHLSRVDPRAGDTIAAGAPIGLVGDSGLAAGPHLHWGVYLHGVAVDPRIFQALED
jgi:murein DD-endopeptidase MepM/ murein hydrolase activator NlpD